MNTRPSISRQYMERLWTQAHIAFSVLLAAQLLLALFAFETDLLPPLALQPFLYVLLPSVVLVCMLGRLQPVSSISRLTAAAVYAYLACVIGAVSGGSLELRQCVFATLMIFRDASAYLTVAAVYLLVATNPALLSPFTPAGGALLWSPATVTSLLVLFGLGIITNREFLKEIGAVTVTQMARVVKLQGESARQRVEHELERTQLEMVMKGVGQAGEDTREVVSSLFLLLRDQERRLVEQEAGTARLSALGQQTSANAQHFQSLLQHLEQGMQNVQVKGAQGGQRLEQLRRLFNSIVHESAQISQDFLGCSQQAEEISKIAQTIESVTRQTRLLSLNAAVEAEKAGEMGRGFGVLAQEIRRLAQQTGHFLKDLELLLREIQEAVSSGASGVSQFVEEVRRSATSTGTITEQINRVLSEGRALETLFQATEQALSRQLQSVLSITRLIEEADGANRSIGERSKQFGRAVSELEMATHKLSNLTSDKGAPALPTDRALQEHAAEQSVAQSPPHLALVNAYVADYQRRFRTQYAYLLLAVGLLQWGWLAYQGAAGPVASSLLLIIEGCSLVLTRRQLPRWACALAVLPLPFLSHHLGIATGSEVDLCFLNLVMAGLSREFWPLATFLISAALLDFSALLLTPPIFWLWGGLLTVFCLIVSFLTRRGVWKVCADRALSEHREHLYNQNLSAAETDRTTRLRSLLDEVLEFCGTMGNSGNALYEMGQRQQGGNLKVIQATQEILASTESVLQNCLSSSDTLLQLQTRSRESLSIAALGETGVSQGRELLATMESAAHLVVGRLQVILSRNEQVAGLVKAIRKIADRVRVISLHAAMEAQRSTGSEHNFNYVAEEIRDLGNRLDVSALNVGRILRNIEERVHANLSSLESFQSRLGGSLANLDGVGQALQGTHQSLTETDTLLAESTALLRRQEFEIRQMQESTLDIEARQQRGENARQELHSVLGALSVTVEKVKWSAAELS